MFEHLLQAQPAPDRTTRARAGKHDFLAWLSAPRLRSDPKPPAVRRLALLPVIALALAGSTLLACGTSDTPESTASEQTASTPTQVATQSTSPTTEKTSDTPSNGRSNSEATTQPEVKPTRAPEAQAPAPTSEPTTPPTDTPVPTPTPQPHHAFAQFMAPYDEKKNLVTRPADEDGQNPIYPFNEIRDLGEGDPYYPAYTQWPVRISHNTLRHPELTNGIRRDIAYAISDAAAELVLEDNGPVPEQRFYTPDDFRGDMYGEIHKRMEWQLVEASPDGITIRVFTTYISPDPLMVHTGPTIAHYRITADAFIKSVKTAESQDGNLYRLRDDHEYGPEFSHLVGEPVIEKQ